MLTYDTLSSISTWLVGIVTLIWFLKSWLLPEDLTAASQDLSFRQDPKRPYCAVVLALNYTPLERELINSLIESSWCLRVLVMTPRELPPTLINHKKVTQGLFTLRTSKFSSSSLSSASLLPTVLSRFCSRIEYSVGFCILPNSPADMLQLHDFSDACRDIFIQNFTLISPGAMLVPTDPRIQRLLGSIAPSKLRSHPSEQQQEDIKQSQKTPSRTPLKVQQRHHLTKRVFQNVALICPRLVLPFASSWYETASHVFRVVWLAVLSCCSCTNSDLTSESHESNIMVSGLLKLLPVTHHQTAVAATQCSQHQIAVAQRTRDMSFKSPTRIRKSPMNGNSIRSTPGSGASGTAQHSPNNPSQWSHLVQSEANLFILDSTQISHWSLPAPSPILSESKSEDLNNTVLENNLLSWYEDAAEREDSGSSTSYGVSSASALAHSASPGMLSPSPLGSSDRSTLTSSAVSPSALSPVPIADSTVTDLAYWERKQ